MFRLDAAPVLVAEAALADALPVGAPDAVVAALAADAEAEAEGVADADPDALELESPPLAKTPPPTLLGVVLFCVFADAAEYASSVFPEDLQSYVSGHCVEHYGDSDKIRTAGL